MTDRELGALQSALVMLRQIEWMGAPAACPSCGHMPRIHHARCHLLGLIIDLTEVRLYESHALLEKTP